MELAMVTVVGMIGAAPLIGMWRAKVWAERNGLRLRAEHAATELASQS